MSDTDLPKQVLNCLRDVLPHSKGFIALHEPTFAGNELRYTKECIDTGWVSSAGKYVDRFELELARYTGAKYAVAVVNGTAALQVSLQLAGVKHLDEVLMPSLTFIATANAVKYLGATPHFVDINYETLGVCPGKLRDYLTESTVQRNNLCVNKKTNKVIRVLLPMHTFGHPVELDDLMNICKEFNLTMVEDAAESLGSLYKQGHTGTVGLISAISFNGNKIVTCGGGGAIITNDKGLAQKAKHLTTTAKRPHKWAFFHDETGYNFRMPNLNAALGVAQLEQLDGFIKNKRSLALKYQRVFESVKGVSFFREPLDCKSNYWLNVLLLNNDSKHLRDNILKLTNDNGFMTRPVWEPMHTLPMYSECPRMDLSRTDNIANRLINIPSSPFLNEL